MNLAEKTLFPLLLCFTCASCNTLQSKEGIGKAVGAVTGYVLGDRASDKYGQEAKIIGGLAGVWIGGQIGRYLDKKDAEKMEQTTRQAAISGKTQNWENPKNKTSGRAEIISSQTKQETITVPVLKDKVKQVPPLEIIGQSFKATAKSRVRGGPGKDYVKVGMLEKGEVTNVVGKVKEADWYLISQDNIGSGFVAMSLLAEAPDETPESKQLNQDALENQNVAAERVCRTIKQSVTLADGRNETQTIEACQGASGWEVQA